MRTFLLGAAIGYVLGTRAGRDRYEQIVRAYRAIIDHPAVQTAAGVARAKISEKTGFGAGSTRSTAREPNRSAPDGQRTDARTPRP